MKKEWCENFDRGECNLEGPVLPSLAETYTERVKIEPEAIELDRNGIHNFLLLSDKYQEGMVIPDKGTLLIPRWKEVTLIKCGAKNCRSKQRQCSHFG